MKSRTITALAQPMKWSVAVPGSKSLMNRALLCAALAKGRSTLTNAVFCEDTNYMIAALQALGVKISRRGTTVTVTGCGGKFLPTPAQKQRRIYIGNAGTVMRFLTPHIPAGVKLVGNARMQQRPLAELQSALATLQKTNAVRITGKVSSQFISALLMYAPTLGRSITITVSDAVVSAPYIKLTLATLQQFGVSVQQRGRRFTIKPQQYRAARYAIEGDASSATYWWALAAMTRSHITVTNVSALTLQPDIRFLKIMRRMGCTVNGTTVIGPWGKPLKPIKLSMADCPDAVMSVAVVAALAPGKSTISHIHHLAAKESNRLRALQLNLRRLGVSARATTNALTITGRNQALWPETIQTYNDHRLAMAFTVLGLARGGVTVAAPQCVAKSYPTFWHDVTAALHQAQQQQLVLTGLRGVGKTTFGQQLARMYQRQFVDLDEAIGQHLHQPIARYVAEQGWPAFRTVEHNVLRATLNQAAQTQRRLTGGIIATGGGTLIYPRNQKLVRPHYVVLLVTPLTVIEQRLRQQHHRPTLLPGSRSVNSELRQVWQQRKEQYYNIADAICPV